jgi:hypothetical protein
VSGDPRVDRVQKAVVDECELLLASDAFEGWKGAASLQPGSRQCEVTLVWFMS